MKELYPKLIGLTLAASLLGTAACSSPHENSGSTTHKTAKPKPAPTIPQVQVRYFPNGSRELILEKLNDSKLTTDDHQGTGTTGTTNIFEWCDGLDLVEQSLGWTDNGVISTSIARTVGYTACADGRLSPSDFSASSAETN